MNAQAQELTVIQTAIAEYRPYAEQLAALSQRHAGVVYDVRSKDGMTAAKAARKELRDLRLALEAERVKIKAPALERTRAIDGDAKLIGNVLLPLEQAVDDQIKAEETRVQREKDAIEEAERERVAAINARFDAIKALPGRAVNASPTDIRSLLDEAAAIDQTTFPDDLQAAAVYEQRLAVTALRAELDRAEQRERDAAELERLRAAAAEVEAERQRLAEVERQRIADEAARAKAADDIARAEQATRDAQEAARLAAEQAEADRAEAVRQAEARATREAEEREARRRADEAAAAEAARIEAERKAANVAHRRKVNASAKAALVAEGFDEEQAERIVVAIAQGKVPNVSIHY